MCASAFQNIQQLTAASNKKRWFKIGACDWSIQQQNDVKAVEVSHQLGLDGVQLSLGNISNDMHLRRQDVQGAYKTAARKFGVTLSGLAIGELNEVPYKSDPRTEQWVSDSIDVAQSMGVNVVLLAFFNKGDLKNDLNGQKEVIRRLKKVAPKAEEKGVTLGIESWLNAEEHMNIINAVNSSYIKVYYDVANSHKMGYPIYDEIRSLGNNICEFHAKEYGHLLGKGTIDFKEVRRAIDDINYSGWLQIEEAIPPVKPMFESYVANANYLKSIFPSKG